MKVSAKAASAEGSAATSLDSILLTSQYETLRRAALGEPVRPEERSGLGLLLRRGICGWARALIVDAPGQPARPSSDTSPVLDPQHQRSVIQAFAAMALGFNKEKAR